jgi:hypothetical protein
MGQIEGVMQTDGVYGDSVVVTAGYEEWKRYEKG